METPGGHFVNQAKKFFLCLLDSADRLRDTLIHEMCHAAAWIKSGVRDGHGAVWKAWAEKAQKALPELPIISRFGENYEILKA